MGFLRVVEVFPPMFPFSKKTVAIDLKRKMASLVEEVRSIKSLCDVVLVANVKNPAQIKLSSVEAASVLQEKLRIPAAPSIVARDENKLQLASTMLTAMGKGLPWMLLVWGDQYPPETGSSNVRDYTSLSEVIDEASSLRRRSKSKTKFLAPVDLRRLSKESGVELARSRIKAGAEFLLAQPPTTDSGETFDKHLSLLDSTGLKRKVLPNVFPFWDSMDVRHCEEYFGWKLPKPLHSLAAKGRGALLEEARIVQDRLKDSGLPGVYLSTRGHPDVAKKILG
jgi:5,10-methylenetetrahydrofolate reductase